MNILPIDEKDLPVLEELINAAYRGFQKSEGSYVKNQGCGWTSEEGIVEGARMDLKRNGKELETSSTVSVLKLEEEGRIIGCVRLEQLADNDTTEMSILSVWPDSQSQGAGSRLIQASEEWARSRRCSVLQITVLSGRDTLVNYYKRRKFQETGESTPFQIAGKGTGIPKIKDLHLIVLKKNLL